MISRRGFLSLFKAAEVLPARTLLDGEIVICDETGWADFGCLQQRLSTARTRVWDTARQRPAVLVVFDVLELAEVDLMALPLDGRRNRLEQLLDGLHPCLQLVAQTADLSLAQDWLTLASLEGVVAKRADRPYISGRARDWIKVKRHRTVDCVLIGVAGEVATPKLVLALRHADGELHHIAITRPIPAE